MSVVAGLEVEVQAAANNVALELRGGGRRRVGEQRAGGVEVSQVTELVVHAAKIIKQVFSFNAPMRHEHPFETTAGRPTGTEVIPLAVGVVHVWNSGRTCDQLRDVRPGNNFAISETAGAINEQTRHQGKPDTATNGADRIDFSENSG